MVNNPHRHAKLTFSNLKFPDSKSDQTINYKKMSDLSLAYKKLFEEINEEIDLSRRGDQTKMKIT